MKMLNTLLQFVMPLAFLRFYGGGGGDGGAGDMRRQEEDRQKKVQQAVDAINAKFGIGPGAGVMPAREQFTTPASGGWITVGGGAEADGVPQWTQLLPEKFDEAGYNKALAGFQAEQAAVGANKQARDKMYTDIGDAVRGVALRDLDQQYTKASRQNTYGLYRAGLQGSGIDAFSGGELQRLYGEGRIKAEQQGVQAGADLRNSDEQTRQRLIGMAQSGLDTGTAASLAAGQMSAAADLAKSQAQGATVGKLFDDLGQAYLMNRVLAARYPNGLPSTGASPYSSSNFKPGAAVGGRVQ